jgi:hypothetical protein
LWRFIPGLWPFLSNCGVAALICHLVFVALHSWFAFWRVAVFPNLLRLPHQPPQTHSARFVAFHARQNQILPLIFAASKKAVVAKHLHPPKSGL